MMADVLWLNNIKLKQTSLPVQDVNDDIKQIVISMFQTMDALHDNSLAAIQIGIALRIVTLDYTGTEGTHRIAMINPVITQQSEQTAVYTEYCSSVPGQEIPVTRHTAVTVSYVDTDNQPQTLHADGVLAVCLQHELDHLDGVLISDTLSPLKRDRLKKQLSKRTRPA